MVGGIVFEHSLLYNMPLPKAWDDGPMEIPSDPAWMSDGACRDMDPNVFFPPTHGMKAAKAICATCPVRPICLEYALENRFKGGVWGGESERARKRMLAARRLAQMEAGCDTSPA